MGINILRLLKEDDIPDENMSLYEYFNDLDDSVLDDFDWYVEGEKPGLNWYRFMLSNFNGLNFSLCRRTIYKELRQRYIDQEGDLKNKQKLAKDLGIAQRTLYKYLEESGVRKA
jgi:hypothetical protein